MSHVIMIVPLADFPEAAETVARWTFDAWASADPHATFEQELAKTRSYARRDTPPIQLLAVEEGPDQRDVLGTAVLRRYEMARFPELEHWLSGVFVLEQARGRGIAGRLVEAVADRARALAIDRLYLQTEDLTGGLYTRYGFVPIEVVEMPTYRALVMARDLGT